MNTFGSRLRAAMAARGPLCAGIDPHPELLAQWGLPDTPAGLEQFALTATEELASEVAAIKPQSAFFERHGGAGIAVLERVIDAIAAGGAQSILDVKRGDIGSTARGYAEAYLDPAMPLGCDSITATPYLGFDSLAPMFEAARAHGTGVIVVTLTSNPEGAAVQRAVDGQGRTVAEAVLARIAELNAGEEPGSIGAVIGATLSEVPDLAINGPILAPGLGAQGATAADLKRLFAPVAEWVLPASSRGLLRHGPGHLAAAARAQAAELAEALR